MKVGWGVARMGYERIMRCTVNPASRLEERREGCSSVSGCAEFNPRSSLTSSIKIIPAAEGETDCFIEISAV